MTYVVPFSLQLRQAKWEKGMGSISGVESSRHWLLNLWDLYCKNINFRHFFLVRFWLCAACCTQT